MYEQRIQSFYDEYTFKGVAVVVTQPNALRIDELDSSDISDPLDEMKVRAAWKHLTYPYLYDSAAEGK